MKKFLLLAVMLFASSVQAQDTIDLTTPYSPAPAVSKMRVICLNLDWENNRVVGVLADEAYTVAETGKSGALTVRTSNQVGSLTMATGHGITTGQKINVAWVAGKRVNVLVGTVAGDVVPISGGRGDQLPAAATAITTPTYTVSYPVKYPFEYSGDDAKTMLKQLNTLDMTTTSMHKRILNRLIADGKLIGTVSGSPD